MARARDARQVVVITGASAGVGRALAREFAEKGAKIGLIARGREGLEAARREVQRLGGEAIVLSLDVAHADEVEAAAEMIEDRLGPIDIWINNAMVSVFSPVHEMTAEEYRRVTEVTYLGYVHGTLSALRRMRPRNRGVIVQVSSALAYRSIPLQSAYCAAKHAILGFSESLRTELIHDRSKVRVTLVHLPALNTPQFNWSRSKMPYWPQPVPPIYQPEVAARAIRWASRHPRSEVKVGFPTVKAIWAEKWANRVADRYLGKKGYRLQLTHEKAPSVRGDNLWNPFPGDAGAHGSFDSISRKRSIQFFMTANRILGLPLGLALLAWPALSLYSRLRETRENPPAIEVA